MINPFFPISFDIITSGLESLAFDILNFILFFIDYVLSHVVQAVYDFFIQSAFNPGNLFPGIGVGNVGYTQSGTPTSQAAGFTLAWFYPNVRFAGEGFVNGLYKINQIILAFVAIPMIFFMIVIQVFAVFFDILEGKLPVWREWFAKIVVGVAFAVLSYWIAGAVLLLGYLPFYAVWTGFTFSPSYDLNTASWVYSSGAVLLPPNVFQYIGSGPAGAIEVIFLAVELMVIFLLWFMVVLRNAIIAFLVAVLPIASILLTTTWTANIGKKLWRLFVELSFLPFFIALPLWIFATLMWQYHAWAYGSLASYVADLGFLIFALGMPYLFLEGIGQLQGMGFPSAGQAVALGTQTGLQFVGLSAALAGTTAMGTTRGYAAGFANTNATKFGEALGGGGGGGGSPSVFGNLSPTVGPPGSPPGTGGGVATTMSPLAQAYAIHTQSDIGMPKVSGFYGLAYHPARAGYVAAGTLGSLVGLGLGRVAATMRGRRLEKKGENILKAKEMERSNDLLMPSSELKEKDPAKYDEAMKNYLANKKFHDKWVAYAETKGGHLALAHLSARKLSEQYDKIRESNAKGGLDDPLFISLMDKARFNDPYKFGGLIDVGPDTGNTNVKSVTEEYVTMRSTQLQTEYKMKKEDADAVAKFEAMNELKRYIENAQRGAWDYPFALSDAKSYEESHSFSDNFEKSIKDFIEFDTATYKNLDFLHNHRRSALFDIQYHLGKSNKKY
ncbi:MAG: hypothetical protein QXO75_06885 [Nitrososphaerota archaeon]